MRSLMRRVSSARTRACAASPTRRPKSSAPAPDGRRTACSTSAAASSHALSVPCPKCTRARSSLAAARVISARSPTTLMKLAQVRKRAALGSLRVLFVSIDPQHDSAPLLGTYLHAFDPAFLGLTGEPASILALAADFGVAVNRVRLPGGEYTMDHSAVVFLLDARARIAAIFTPPLEVPALAADLRRAAPYL